MNREGKIVYTYNGVEYVGVILRANVEDTRAWVTEDALEILLSGGVPEMFLGFGDMSKRLGEDHFEIFFAPKSDPQVTPQDIHPDAYSGLRRVLDMAFAQASQGKGKERHANGREFDRQPIMELARMHGLGYPTGQAAKKLQEAHTLLRLRGKEAAIQEILGAINYAAAAVLLIEEMEI